MIWGHARALVTMNDPVAQLSLYNLILDEELSVRKVETIVREFSDGGEPIPKSISSGGSKSQKKETCGKTDAT